MASTKMIVEVHFTRTAVSEFCDSIAPVLDRLFWSDPAAADEIRVRVAKLAETALVRRAAWAPDSRLAAAAEAALQLLTDHGFACNDEPPTPEVVELRAALAEYHKAAKERY